MKKSLLFRAITITLTIGILFLSTIIHAQNINTVAGHNSSSAYSGDGLPAVFAGVDPYAIAIDDSGNLYIADRINNRIRVVAAATGTLFGQSMTSGYIYTIAGKGTGGFNGDGIAAVDAQLNGPTGVAVDDYGNVYIADHGNGRIREINGFNNQITTIAGGITCTYPDSYDEVGDGQPAIQACLNSPGAVAVDDYGNVYFSDQGSNYMLNYWRVREVVTYYSDIQPVAGSGSKGYSGDNGTATSAELWNPYGVVIDNNFNVYFVDSSSVRKVAAHTGIISPFAGTSTRGYSGDGGPALQANLSPSGLEIYQAGGLGIDGNNNIYIADNANSIIRKVSNTGNPANNLITTIAGTPQSPGYSGDYGLATSAQLMTPTGVAVDLHNNIFIADYGNHVVREVTANASGINNIKASTGITIYPNPASETVNIQGITFEPNAVIIVTDITGKRIAVSNGVASDKIALHTQFLEAGTYFIEIQQLGESYTGRFVKMN